MIMLDVLFEENDRLIIFGSVNVMDHAKNTMAHMSQMSPAFVKKMTTLFQVTLAEQPFSINYPEHCYIFRGTVTYRVGLA